MRAHIDVRGVWPVYVSGLIAIQLDGFPRNIIVENAETYLKAIGKL